jgi:hypothetical protein
MNRYFTRWVDYGQGKANRVEAEPVGLDVGILCILFHEVVSQPEDICLIMVDLNQNYYGIYYGKQPYTRSRIT